MKIKKRGWSKEDEKKSCRVTYRIKRARLLGSALKKRCRRDLRVRATRLYKQYKRDGKKERRIKRRDRERKDVPVCV